MRRSAESVGYHFRVSVQSNYSRATMSQPAAQSTLNRAAQLEKDYEEQVTERQKAERRVRPSPPPAGIAVRR